MCVLWLVASTSVWADGTSPFAQRLTKWLSSSQRGADEELIELRHRLDELPPLTSGHRGENAGFHSFFQETRKNPLNVILDLGKVHPIDRIALFPVQGMFRGEVVEGYGFPGHFIVELSKTPDFRSGVSTFDSRIIKAPPRPDYPWQFEPAAPIDAQYVRLRVLEHWTREDGRFLSAFGELMILANGRNVALRSKVKTRSSFTSLPDWELLHLVDGQTDLGTPVSPEPSPTNGFLTKGRKEPDTKEWVQLELQSVVRMDELVLVPSQPVDAPDQFGHGFPRRFRLMVSDNPEFDDARVVVDHQTIPFPNPGNNPAVFSADGALARFARLEVDEMWHISNGRYSIALAETMILENGTNVALGAKVTASDIFLKERYLDVWRPEYLVDGFSSQNRLINLKDWLEGLEERKGVELRIGDLEQQMTARVERTLAWVFGLTAILVSGLLLVVGMLVLRRKRALEQQQEELRSRIARDLHDDLGSRLGGMRLLSENMLNVETLPGELRDDLDLLHRSSGEATDAMRDIVWLFDSRESSLDKLRQQMKRLLPTIVGSLPCDCQIVGRPEGDVGFEFRREVLFAFRESLNNAARHSGSDRIECRVGGSDHEFWFEVRDWGRGFNEEEVERVSGVANLRKRAETLEGTVEIESHPETGTKITFKASFQNQCI